MSAKPWVGKKVVIIDDSAYVREDLARTFQACGMQVVGTGKDGVEGLALVQQHRPEIVSIDVIMPEMDGIECYRKISAFDPEVKCIMISWLAGEARILENLKDIIPAHLFQPKPVTAQNLEIRLGAVYFPEKHALAANVATANKPTVDDAAANDFLGDLGVKVS